MYLIYTIYLYGGHPLQANTEKTNASHRLINSRSVQQSDYEARPTKQLESIAPPLALEPKAGPTCQVKYPTAAARRWNIGHQGYVGYAYF